MAKSTAKRPGVMLWFDIRPSLKRLSNEEKGRLFEAIMDYGETGVLPDFEGMTGIAWDFIRPRIDLDAERYEQAVQQRRDAVNKRWHGEQQRDTAVSPVLRNIPTTTTNANTTTDSSTTAEATATAPPTTRGQHDPDESRRLHELVERDRRGELWNADGTFRLQQRTP